MALINPNCPCRVLGYQTCSFSANDRHCFECGNGCTRARTTVDLEEFANQPFCPKCLRMLNPTADPNLCPFGSACRGYKAFVNRKPMRPETIEHIVKFHQLTTPFSCPGWNDHSKCLAGTKCPVFDQTRQATSTHLHYITHSLDCHPLIPRDHSKCRNGPNCRSLVFGNDEKHLERFHPLIKLPVGSSQ